MPLLIQGKRTSRGLSDEIDDVQRKSTEMKSSYRHFEVGAGPSLEDEETDACLSSDEPISCVRLPLSASSYSKFDLLHHLHQISRNDTAVISALGDVYLQRKELTIPTLFTLDSSVLDSEGYPDCEVFDVDRDSLIMVRIQSQTDRQNDADDSSRAWNLLKVRINTLSAPSPAASVKVKCRT